MPPKRDPKVDNTIFELKVQTRLLERESNKAKKKEQVEKLKVKEALKKGNDEGARIYAENAIREKNTSLQYLKMAAKLEGVASRLNVMQITSNIMNNLEGMNKALEAASKSVDLNKYSQVLDQFGKNMDNIDDITAITGNKLDDATGSSVGSEEVDKLLNDVRQEVNINIDGAIGSLNGPVNVAQQQQVPAQQQPQQQLLEPMGMGGGGYQAKPSPNYQQPPQNAQPAPQNFQQAPQNFQQAPQNFQQYPQNFQQAPQNFQQAPQNFQQYPQNFQQTPQNFQQTPQNFQETPQNFQQTPQNFQQAPPAPAEDDLQSRLDRLMRNG